MPPKIRIITLGGVNAYLITATDGFVLIDTGTPEQRAKLIASLTEAGCAPGRLRLEFFIDDLAAATASLRRLRALGPRRVYPGHGKPFGLEQVRRPA